MIDEQLLTLKRRYINQIAMTRHLLTHYIPGTCILHRSVLLRGGAKLHTRRESSFFYSRAAGVQHFIAGFVCAGTELAAFFVREWAVEYSRETRLCGNGISHFHGTAGYGTTRYFSHFSRGKEYGIPGTGFLILHGTTG